MTPTIIELGTYHLFVLVLMSPLMTLTARVSVLSVTLGFTRFVVVFLSILIRILIFVSCLMVPLAASIMIVLVIFVLEVLACHDLVLLGTLVLNLTSLFIRLTSLI